MKTRPNPTLIDALRRTADRLLAGASYQWSHQGSCNCGHLVQTVTRHSKSQIHAMALEKAGDWSEKAIEYCPGSGYPIDHILETLWDLGLAPEDVVNLEHLSDPMVLKRLPPEYRHLQRNNREDLLVYLNLWADLLEEGGLSVREKDDLTHREVEPAGA